MLRNIILSMVLFLSLLSFSGCQEGSGNSLSTPLTKQDVLYKPDELIVTYKQSVRKSAIDSIHNKYGSTVKKELLHDTQKKIDLITIPNNTNLDEAIRYYKNQPEVESVEPNRIIKKHETIPDDPEITKQWHLNYRFDESNASTIDINATSAWDLHQGDYSVTVAIIDTGIDSSHPDLRHQLWHNTQEGVIADGIDNDGNGYVDDMIGYDFVDKSANPIDDDVDGHGTHVAGLIGAEGNNAIGTSGVSWKVSLMALKILDSNGYGSISDEVEAIYYAVNNGAGIINMSLGGTCGDSPSNAEYEAIRYARDKGVLVVTSAGNDGCDNDQSPAYPAGHPLNNIIAVGALNKTGATAWFSNYGRHSVHISAPGESIYSTLPVTKNSYGSLSGTSMAAPIVTGSAALVLASDPTLGYLSLREKLLGSVTPDSALESSNLVSGRLNVGNAITWDPGAHAPVKPSLISTSLTDGGVSLQWIDNSSNETAYRVVRTLNDSQNTTKTWDLEANTTSFVDTNPIIDEGNTVSYRIEAVNSIGVTSSNTLTINNGLKAPLITSIEATYANNVVLTWDDLSSIEEGYIIYRSDSFWGGFQEIARTQANVVSYTDQTTLPSTTYYYLVKAYTTSSYSESSNMVEVVTPSELAPQNSVSKGGGSADGMEILLLAVLLIFVLKTPLKNQKYKYD